MDEDLRLKKIPPDHNCDDCPNYDKEKKKCYAYAYLFKTEDVVCKDCYHSKYSKSGKLYCLCNISNSYSKPVDENHKCKYGYVRD